jgi:hypothetical protein
MEIPLESRAMTTKQIEAAVFKLPKRARPLREKITRHH